MKFGKIDQWLIGERKVMKTINRMAKTGELAKYGITKEECVEMFKQMRPYATMSFKRGAIAGAIGGGIGLLAGGYLALLREIRRMIHGEDEKEEPEEEKSEEEA